MQKWNKESLISSPSRYLGRLNDGKQFKIPKITQMAIIGESQKGTMLALDYIIASLMIHNVVNVIELKKPYRYNQEIINGKYMNELPESSEGLAGINVFVKTPVNDIFAEKLEPVLGDTFIIHYNFIGNNPCLLRLQSLGKEIPQKIFIAPSEDSLGRNKKIPMALFKSDDCIVCAVDIGVGQFVPVGCHQLADYDEAHETFKRYAKSIKEKGVTPLEIELDTAEALRAIASAQVEDKPKSFTLQLKKKPKMEKVPKSSKRQEGED